MGTAITSWTLGGKQKKRKGETRRPAAEAVELCSDQVGLRVLARNTGAYDQPHACHEKKQSRDGSKARPGLGSREQEERCWEEAGGERSGGGASAVVPVSRHVTCRQRKGGGKVRRCAIWTGCCAADERQSGDSARQSVLVARSLPVSLQTFQTLQSHPSCGAASGGCRHVWAATKHLRVRSRAVEAAASGVFGPGRLAALSPPPSMTCVVAQDEADRC